ncbi:MAG: molybdenum cofactor biosynthesis protein B [Acidobacteriota bacterium]
MGHREHRRRGARRVPCAVVTVSDSRDEATDRSGTFIRDALRRAGHPLADYRILRDEPRLIRRHLVSLARRARVRVVVISGGTGVARRDTTYEAVAGLLEKTIDGFGEIFRMLSFRRIGAAAMLSRAVAGIYRGMVVFSVPGSEPAVRLAMERLILPELTHLDGLLSEGRGG